MVKVKKPKWDKPISLSASGSYGPDTIIQSNHIDEGMTVQAKLKSVEVIIKITKVENKYDTEGTIIKINSKTEIVDNLSVGDSVFINRWDIERIL